MNQHLTSMQPGFLPHRHRRWRWGWPAILLLVLALVLGGGFWYMSSSSSVTIVKGLPLGADDEGTATIVEHLPPLDEDPEYVLPNNDDDRLDILLLGIRGEGDTENGGLLTDTILLFSMDLATGRATLTSIPRDLTVRLSNEYVGKINAAYIINGTNGVKRLFSRITGIGIDHVVVIDFEAFRQVVDTLGGVTVYLNQPFEESQQWAGTASDSYVFSLPAGENVLDGDQALYYVRSRYSTNDFDRSRRQMQVILAIKSKVEGLNLLSDPLTALSLANTVRKHVDTDLNIFDLGTLKQLLAQGDHLDRIGRYQLTTENLLYETLEDGIYELLPRGDTLAHIKKFFATILDDEPIMSAPTLTPSPTPEPSLEP